MSNSLQPHGLQTPGVPVLHHIPEFAQIYVHWVSDAIQPSYPLLSPSPLPSIFPSISVFSNESALCNRWPKYWSFSFSNYSPSNEYSGLISFRIGWFISSQSKGLSRVFSNSKASVLQCSAFLMVQLSHPYMTTREPWFWLWSNGQTGLGPIDRT